MTQKPKRPSSVTRCRIVGGIGLVLFSASSAFAQSPSTQPVYPALEQLNRESVELYERLQFSCVRVQLPTPKWLAEASKEDRWQKYNNLSPQVKRELQQRGNRAGAANPTQSAESAGNSEGPASQSAQQAKLPAVEGTGGNNYSGNNSFDNGSRQQGYTIILPPQQAVEPQQQLQILNNAGAKNQTVLAYAANNLGLLLNDKGYVLVPAYVEREAVGDQPIKLTTADGQAVDARFIGSDHQTQLTVLQLPAAKTAVVKALADQMKKKPAEVKGGPVKLSSQKLTEGTLVMMLSPTDGAARLTVWNGGARDYGIVVTIDGQVCGIARFGQFLSGAACQLIADEIIRHGSVRRATLGIIITQIDPADPARQNNAELGDKPAMRVDQVMKGSAAEKGGLQQGDLILSLEGEAVHDIPSLSAGIAARQGPTELRVLREGKVITVQVDLMQK